MRTNLKVYRVRKNLSQGEMAEKIGCSRAAYAAIENGTRDGRKPFWNSFQKAFEVPEAEMWELMKNE